MMNPSHKPIGSDIYELARSCVAAFIGVALSVCPTSSLAEQAALKPTPTYLPAPVLDIPVSVSDAAARRKTGKVTLRKIILVGDSTVQVNSGWGGAFCAHHVTTYVACVNMGRGGRSTLSYRTEGSWDYALNEAKVPGYSQVFILIQFGHNDQPGKPGHSTDLQSEFPQNLTQFVVDARATGAVPILVTPLTRRVFVDGSLQDSLAPWAAAARKVANEMGVPLIDLHAMSVDTVQAMGPVESLSLSSKTPSTEELAAAKTGTSRGARKPAAPTVEVAVTENRPQTQTFDYTHLGARGAELFARQVAQTLVTIAPELQKQVLP
ncbi:rhamnogalacturonan acetylesterase [Asticcacaulis sp. BYS171W]|uniref:Rhamnogalacturonan acetylesterase n=1 Tax=Asticcacaulis aquaticus TaxID=2984212 RepID=A0ABT5HPX9_9CAUL|nr:rhamnogalacturonan acetylesterase [Asticcacaulis aquaticus]MDC7682128.1 rhamnogalacturonan acetylesterase [Asticcacaulis aquaticus]